MSYKGKFKPKNISKYKGDHTAITYRSSWELLLMRKLDKKPNVLKWSSEEIVIPYRSPIDGKRHRYFPDFFIKYVTTKGQIVREIIEVKPKKQLKPPKEPKRQTKRYLNEVATYVVNQAKFAAANEYCNDRKYGFRILTEDHLVPKKGKKK